MPRNRPTHTIKDMRKSPRFTLFLPLILVLGNTSVAQTTSFSENWAAPTSSWFGLNARSPGKALSNQADTGADDGKALLLQVPANAITSPGGGPQAETANKTLYRTFTGRIKTVDCTGQPDAGVVTGFFTYFNDGSDQNGDGLADNSEIDFEWLCAEPQTIYLTMWTDYNEDKHKRVGRQINMATGAIKYSSYFEDFGSGQPLTGTENQPKTLAGLPGFNSAARYYEYGFSWSASRVTWWLVHPTTGETIVLWDYQGNAGRIPARPSYYMINAWHSNTWSVDTRPTAIKTPSSPVSAYVDWTKYDPGTTTGLIRGGTKEMAGKVKRGRGEGLRKDGSGTMLLPREGSLMDLQGRRQENPH